MFMQLPLNRPRVTVAHVQFEQECKAAGLTVHAEKLFVDIHKHLLPVPAMLDALDCIRAEVSTSTLLMEIQLP